jgi:ATP-binding protein involved in chromosome partitioning
MEQQNMAVTKEAVLAGLAAVPSPDGTPLPRTGKLSDIVASDGKVFFSITVDAAVVQAWEPVRKAAEAAVRALPGVTSAMVALTGERAARSAPAQGAQAPQGGGAAPHAHAHGRAAGPAGERQLAAPGVGAIIAVASGKGGVGKSTTAVNLALGLRDLGLAVGMLDADIYGPSVPKLLAIRGKPEMLGGNKLRPMEGYGLKVMSIGFLVEEETPMIWRGPMVISALTQMLRDVEWGTLDVMVVDMPPGTGDAQLTMAQQVPLKGAVIVSTPQDLALIDARRGIAMFNRVNVPVLGVVENMSYFVCPKCGERSDIFGHGGAQHEAERQGVPFLGAVPLHMDIRETSDAGRPVVATDPDGPHAQAYRAIAAKVHAALGGAGARAAPKIVIEA